MASYLASDQIDVVLSRLENNDQMFPRDDIRKALNWALQISNLYCGWSQAAVSMYTVANRTAYDTPSNMIFPMAVSFEGRVINKSPLSSLAYDNPRLWTDTTATTGRNVSDWALIGLRKFVIFPADATGGKLLQISGVVEPALFESEVSTVNCPSNIMGACLDYATHMVQVKLGGKTLMDSMEYFKKFQEFMKLNMMWRTFQQPYFKAEVSAAE